MWTPIFEQNKENIIDILEAYIHNLQNFKNKLEEEIFSDLYQQMKNTNQLSTILNGIKPLN